MAGTFPRGDRFREGEERGSGKSSLYRGKGFQCAGHNPCSGFVMSLLLGWLEACKLAVFKLGFLACMSIGFSWEMG